MAAGYVTGLDVEEPCSPARGVDHARAVELRIGLVKVAPGPFPFAPDSFRCGFSKDSLVHIAEARADGEVFRVLKPGRFIASDWLIA